jgi:hypothetical protein
MQNKKPLLTWQSCWFSARGYGVVAAHCPTPELESTEYSTVFTFWNCVPPLFAKSPPPTQYAVLLYVEHAKWESP